MFLGLGRWQWWDETELIYIHPLAHRPSATTLPQAVSPTIRDQQCCWSNPQHQSWTDFCHNPNHLKRLTTKVRAPEQTHPLETHPKTLTLQYCDGPVFPLFCLFAFNSDKTMSKMTSHTAWRSQLLGLNKMSKKLKSQGLQSFWRGLLAKEVLVLTEKQEIEPT